ncbi:MAG: hypothetical protein K9L28_09120 [Synergistales bacterium]|nr:hypothetical protein [Synergistales bacterium]
MDETEEKLDSLLDELYQTEDPERIQALATRILEISPEDPEALVFLSDVAEDNEESIELLERSTREIRRLLDLADQEGEKRRYLVTLLVEVLQRLGCAYIFGGQGDRALEVAELLDSLPESTEPLWHALFRYSGLLLTGQYQAVLEQVMAEEEPTIASAHARAMATFELAGKNEESWKALWNAFRAAPNLPFYLLDYWEPPEEGETGEEDVFAAAMVLQPAWTATEDRVMFLSTATVFFGFVTERLPESLLKEVHDELRQTPVFPVLEMTRNQLKEAFEGDEGKVDLQAQDNMALDILSRMEELGGE